jgi:polar amino acid transport system substrate-binding protein
MTDSISAVRSELAPTGTLRVALNMSNFLLTATDPVTGELVRVQGADNAFKRFVADKLDALAGLRPRLITDQDNLPGSRLLDGNFTAVQQAAGTPKGRPAGARYLCAFIEDIKATGLVARTIAKHNVRDLTVAPKA